jgi:FkbM family methyltransferase
MPANGAPDDSGVPSRRTGLDDALPIEPDALAGPDVTAAASAIRRLAEVASVACTPGGPDALLRWHPRSLASFRTTTALRRASIRPTTVLDVGANVGQFSRAARSVLGAPIVHAFEPHAEAARSFRRNLAGERGVVLHEVALGAAPAAAELHRHASTLASSLRPVRSGATEAWARDQLTPAPVEVRRLDDVLGETDIRPPTLLKIDVQGTELDVLAGVGRHRASLTWLLVEVSFTQVYEGEPLFDEVHTHLAAQDWGLMWPVDALRGTDGSVAQLDLLYRSTR